MDRKIDAIEIVARALAERRGEGAWAYVRSDEQEEYRRDALTALEVHRLCASPSPSQRLVVLESPYAGDIEANVEYARKCVRDSLLRGEAPIASHLLYTQPGILRDEVPDERERGINAGLAWRAVAQASVVYTDRGISKGMEYGIAAAKAAGVPVEYRSISEADHAHS